MSENPLPDHHDRLLGALFGVAIGDALGLPYEGLSARRVARRFDGSRYRLLGRIGFVSDDTEQTALVAQALARGESDAETIARFRRSMVGWFLRLPFGLGWATLRACVRMTLGMKQSGVASAGNGAAMRAGVLGVYLRGADEATAARRHTLGSSLAALTHTDVRAIEAARFVAEVGALAARSRPTTDRSALVEEACTVLDDGELIRAVHAGLDHARKEVSVRAAAAAVGHTGFVVHTLGLCVYCFARRAARPLEVLHAAILAGGDTDTHAAIVGGWLGALHGRALWPDDLVNDLQPGPFGRRHLEGLASALATGHGAPRWSWLVAMARNLAMYPVILAHGFRRLF